MGIAGDTYLSIHPPMDVSVVAGDCLTACWRWVFLPMWTVALLP